MTKYDKAAYASPAMVNFVRPGLSIQITSATVAADGTITAHVKFADPRGLGLDRLGITTPGAITCSLIAAYIPKGGSQYTAYTTRTQTSPITKVSAIQAGNLSDTVYSFVPATSTAVKDLPRDVIRTATCNKCHWDMHFHGETGRKSMEVCVLCHQPQTIDPDTGNTVDMPVMTHKIHMGEHLPSVVAGGKYIIIGNGQSVNDFSEIAFPSDIAGNGACRTCHESNRGAKQADNWMTKPNQAACGACHDDVNFASGKGHVNLPQVSDSQCSTCHQPIGDDFLASVSGAHVVAQQSSLLTGLVWKLLKVDNGVAGKAPTVTFALQDKNNDPLTVADMARLAFVLAGPTTDFTAFTTGYVSEQVTAASPGLKGGPGTYTYTFTTVIPATAKGTYTIGMEGRRLETVMGGTVKQRNVQYGAPNQTIDFAVDSSPVRARRAGIAVDKCNACHTRLALHGENRLTINQCVLCHNPKETDAARRPAAENPAETVDMAYMIHRIHGGEEVTAASGTRYVVYGFGGSKNDFSEVGYPAPRQVCDMCHLAGTYNPPLPRTSSVVNTPRYYTNPTGPTAASCAGCHQSVDAASHFLANTTILGESCGACHSSSSEFSISKVHAVATR
ncbi:MAG: OmcA/MtrC family decaheme c-type cytochrome [Acidobacteria bacterium]|nr:OmcA/MtrC family decaheme c-type cytochrome [Acidobacteriota bacterium]